MPVLFLLFLLLTTNVYAADTKITALTADTSPTTDDLVATVDNPGGTPTNKKVTLSDIKTLVTTTPTITTSLTMSDAANIILNTTTGSKIGTATTQKLGFYNSTPIVQPTGNVCTALQNLGLVASCTENAGTGGWTDGGTNVYLTTTSDNVGIGTTTPNSATLEIVKQSSTVPLKVSSGATGNGDLFIITSAGNVGINTTTAPANALVVNGTIQTVSSSAGSLQLTEASANGSNYIALSAPSTLSADKTYTLPTADGNSGDVLNTNGSGTLSWATPAASGGWTDGGTNVYTTSTTDNVGIGTTTPSTTLEIVKQSTSSPLMVSSVATGDGDYLIILSGGNVGIATIAPTGKFEVKASGGNIVMASSGGNVGIGTALPNNKLSVGSSTAIGAAYSTIAAPSNGLLVQGNVGIGTVSPMNALQVNGTFQVDQTNNIGWTPVNAANQACNTTCVSGCVFGMNTGALGNFVACTDATADTCICAGPS